MGESIRSTATPNTLIAAGASTLAAARLVGGLFTQLAEQLLVAELDAAAANTVALSAAQTALATAVLTRDMVARRADLLIAACHDELWNGLGRPAHDGSLAIAFPMASKTCSARNALRPARMMAVATVLAGQVHSRLPRVRCAEMAEEIRALAKELRAANDAAADAEALRLQCAEVQVALGKVVHARLAALKRVLKAHGFSEVDVHRVIPARRRTRGRAAPKPAAPWAEDLAGSAGAGPEVDTDEDAGGDADGDAGGAGANADPAPSVDEGGTAAGPSAE